MSAVRCATPPLYLPTPGPSHAAPEETYHPQLRDATHCGLKLRDDAPVSPQSENVEVKVFDASSGISIPFTLKSSDTTDLLMKKYLKKKSLKKYLMKEYLEEYLEDPDRVRTLHLAYNGKPVSMGKRLCELGLKTGATFITYHKCVGG